MRRLPVSPFSAVVFEDLVAKLAGTLRASNHSTVLLPSAAQGERHLARSRRGGECFVSTHFTDLEQNKWAGLTLSLSHHLPTVRVCVLALMILLKPRRRPKNWVDPKKNPADYAPPPSSSLAASLGPLVTLRVLSSVRLTGSSAGTQSDLIVTEGCFEFVRE